MEPEVYFSDYYEVETVCGTEIIPADVLRGVEKAGDLDGFLEGEPLDPDEPIEAREGWLYRLQMPGYLDCTDWCVAATEAEAYADLLEYYGGSGQGESRDRWDHWEEHAHRKAGLCLQCGRESRGGDTCSEECDLREVELHGPQEDDITTEDHETFYQYGKVYVEVEEGGDWRRVLADRMDEDQFWPNVFWISDHGNIHLIRELCDAE